MKRSGITRRQIVDHVRQEICRHGISRLTMDDIARGMKMSKRTLYQLFPQKTFLIRLCLTDIASEARKKLPDGAQDAVPEACIERLFLVVGGYITLLHTLGGSLLADLTPDADYRGFVQWERDFWRRQVLDALDRCRTCGCLLPYVEPELVTDLLLNTLFKQCCLGIPGPTQQLLGHTLLRGAFRREEIGYIDGCLAQDGLPV